MVWTVSIARVGDDEPTVLEAELLPREGALLAPDWVPWAERLADYQARAGRRGRDRRASDEDVDDEFADVDDLDAADFDADGSPILHAGDVDGVDIDVLDEADEDEDDADSTRRMTMPTTIGRRAGRRRRTTTSRRRRVGRRRRRVGRGRLDDDDSDESDEDDGDEGLRDY